MAGGPRDYSTGTERALYQLSRGSCYYPGCDVPVVKFVDGEPIANVEIAHIRGANENSRRYDATMTDSQRAHFSNLILLCIVHHKLIDKVRPQDYSESMLEGWKSDREGSAVDAASLSEVTKSDLEQLLEQVAAKYTPKRLLELDLRSLVLDGSGGGYTLLMDRFPAAVGERNASGGVSRELVLLARNVGYSRVSIQEFRIEFLIDVDGEQRKVPVVGHNSFVENPSLPVTIESGGPEVPWLVSEEIVRDSFQKLKKYGTVSFRGYARLSSGEEVTTATVAIVDGSSVDSS